MIPRIREVDVRNYKSIAQVKVGLEPFTVFVGRNGVGKSNLIDSLAFVQDCLSESLEQAFRTRGGIGAVRRRSGGHPTHMGISLTIDFADGVIAKYGFEIAAKPNEGFQVAHEKCEVRKFRFGSSECEDAHVFEVAKGKFKQAIPGLRPQVQPDRLALFAASATEEFRPVFDFLTSMRVYSVVPSRLRELQEPDAGTFLKSDGSNAAAVLKRLAEGSNGSHRYETLCRLLSKIVSGLERVEYRAVGQKETIQFKQDVGQKHPWGFNALNMSDGTLRALGLLLAVYQPGNPSVIAVEEPEATVHPAVMELIVGVLKDAARERQILLTTHSPDMLDDKELDENSIRMVTLEQSKTLVCTLSEASRTAIRDNLYTAGELLRSNELTPDLQTARKQAEQMDLFAHVPPPDTDAE